MKHMRFPFILLTLSIIVIITGCKKLEYPNEETKKVIGQWRYVSSTNTVTGASLTSLNNSNWIEFKSDGYYRLFENDTQLEKSKFRFEERKSIAGGERMMIIYHTGSSRVHSFDLVGDTLHLLDEYYDGFSFKYVKK